jgi:hypothetical protein
MSDAPWEELLTPQFLLALLVVGGWLVALAGPLSHVSDEFGSGDGEAITELVQNVLALSGLFSPVVGAVFGYYFGAAGTKRAERQADEATRQVQSLLAQQAGGGHG